MTVSVFVEKNIQPIDMFNFLLQRVPTIARQIFVLILDSLLKELYEDERNLFTKKVQDAMNSILCSTKEYDPMLVGAILQVGLHNSRHISLVPEYVAVGR